MSTRTIIVLALVAVFGGAAVGYFLLASPHAAPRLDQVQVAQSPGGDSSATPQTTVPERDPSPKKHGTDYTAPGAPHIDITEEKTPSLTDGSRTAKASVPDEFKKPDGSDSEASQQDVPTPPVDTASGTGSTNGSTSDNPKQPGDQSPNPADQDYEKIGGRDAQSNSPQPGNDGDLSKGKPLFRVQTGSFIAERNAQGLADALKRRGYTASSRSEQIDDKTVYKVQTGAYHTREAANRAALALQRSGYPAYVSPITP